MDLNLIKDLVFVEGVSGFESKIRERIKKEIEKLKPDDIKVDNLGNLIAIKKGKSDNFILLAAHMDELGLVVSAIDDNGLISFKKIGGIDDRVLLSRVFRVLGSKGDVIGVTGLLPPHLTTDGKTSESVIPWHDLKIDIGAKSKQEVLEKGIEIGTPIVFQKEFYINNDYIISRGLDDRVGVYILIKILEHFSKIKPFNNIIIAFTVEEEIGLRGASVLANNFNPDFVIAVDSMSSTDIYNVPSVYKNSINLDKGPVIRKVDTRMIVDEEVFDFVKKIAIKTNIPYQIGVSGGSTDASIIEITNKGFKAVPLCVPIRYTHSTVEICSIKDIENLISLCIEIIENNIEIL
ncbi:MAG: M42 family metallopeptidase [Caldisericia bacterium]